MSPRIRKHRSANAVLRIWRNHLHQKRRWLSTIGNSTGCASSKNMSFILLFARWNFLCSTHMWTGGYSFGHLNSIADIALQIVRWLPGWLNNGVEKRYLRDQPYSISWKIRKNSLHCLLRILCSWCCAQLPAVFSTSPSGAYLHPCLKAILSDGGF